MITLQRKIERLKELFEEAKRIVDSSATWEAKYELIFPGISQQVRKYVDLQYYDPDSSYEDDVCAYVRALEQKLKDYGSLVEAK